jgi:hypothetical protein
MVEAVGVDAGGVDVAFEFGDVQRLRADGLQRSAPWQILLE